ncbi:MAG: hypothetical protein ACOY0T_04265 [Myxococcota bacterium]
MFNKISIGLVGALGILAASATVVSARSVVATDGRPLNGAQWGCFNANVGTGAVTSTCNANFEIPLVLDTFGAKVVNMSARATAGGAACRSVGNNRVGTAFTASPWVPVPVAAGFVNMNLAGAVVPGNGVLFVDCVTNPGTSFIQFDYAP